MILSEIYDLKQYIISQVGVNCVIGNDDLAPDQYPIIQILLIEPFEIFRLNKKLEAENIIITLRLVVAKGDEVKAFEVLEKVMMELNQFNPHKGHMLTSTVEPEYIEDTKTYVLNIPYMLKIITQDT